MHLCSGRFARILATGAAALIAAAGVAVSGEAAAPAPAASTSSATSTPFCAPATPGHRSCFGMRLNVSARAQARAALLRGSVSFGPAGGYTPQDIQSAYRLAGTVGTNGVGQTIAVIDGPADPFAASDLATYRAQFNLPTCAFGTAATSCLRIVNQTGGQAVPTVDQGWSAEISLDLDAVSTSCPLCHILLVEADSSSDLDLIAAVQEASAQHATVQSLSFGGCEIGPGPGDFDSALQSANVPITVATGDSGYNSADNQSCSLLNTPQYPASSPFVTAVGGTSLATSANTRGWAETAWAYTAATIPPQGGGSGCSGFETKPAWQTDTGCSNRTVADISADADPQTGLSVYNKYSDTGWSVYGGTSLSAPLIAGIYALANSPTAAVDGHIWYQAPALNDVTSGSNAPSPSDCSPAYLCNSVTGYDGPTGMGTPNGPPIINPTVVTTPSSTTMIPVSWSPPPGINPSRYQVWEQDNTNGTGRWLPWVSTTVMSTNFYGFAGHKYGFAVQYFMPNGSSNGPPLASATSTTIAGATLAMPFTGMYAVDGYGVLHPASSPPLASALWPGWNIVRGVVSSATGKGGIALDGWGGLHPFGDSAPATATASWPGWDITAGIATLPGRSSGYVLDGWGNLHPFSVGGTAMPNAVTGNAFWYGWSIARGAATFSDGSGGVVLDGWGGIHPFAVSPNAQPAAATMSGYWYGWDIARSLVLLPGSTPSSYQGYVLDGWGGLHPFASVGVSPPPTASTGSYWQGWDIARSVVMVPGSATDGYVVDGYGGYHPFGFAPTVVTPNYAANASPVHGASAA